MGPWSERIVELGVLEKGLRSRSPPWDVQQADFPAALEHVRGGSEKPPAGSEIAFCL